VGGFSLSTISGEKTESQRGGSDYWLVKLDGNGNMQWDKTIGGDGDEYCHALYQTADSGYIIGGSSSSGISGEKTEPDRGGVDYWAVKLDKNRNVQWDKTIGGDGDDWCNNLIQTKSGGYMLVGGSFSDSSADKKENSRGGADYWVVDLDHQGQLISEKTIGGTADDWGLAAVEPQKDKFLIGGSSASGVGADKTEFSRGGNDFWIVHLNYNKPNSAALINANIYSQATQKDVNSNHFTIAPNPVSNSTTISFVLAQSQKASLQIFDMNGRLIETLVDGQMQQGSHQLTWDAKDEKGNMVSAGVYFLKMQAGNYAETRKLVVVK
jgi:hypothetical protein